MSRFIATVPRTRRRPGSRLSSIQALVESRSVWQTTFKMHSQRTSVKEAKYYVLKHTKAPAILVEVGFISHDETAKKLFSYSYQEKLSRVIFEGISKTIDA